MLPDLPKRPRFYDVEKRKFTLDEMRFLGTQTTLGALGFNDCPIGDDHVKELAPLAGLGRLFLDGTKVTDACFETVAQFKKLEFLTLDRTKIDGKGLVHLAGHPGLKTLWLNGTKVNDKTIAAAAGIPKLATLCIRQTKVTAVGLMALAVHPKLKVVGDQFSEEEMAAFEAVQRAGGKPRVQGESPDLEAAKAALLQFFEAMAAWETWMNTHDDAAEGKARCAAVVAKHCTVKDRKFGNPNAISYSNPPEYGSFKVVDAELPTKSKAVVYVKDAWDQQRRFTLVKKNDAWLVDKVESFLDGWGKAYL